MAHINSLLYLWRAWTCSPGQTPVSPAWTGRCGDQDKWHIPQVFGSPGGSSPWLCLEKVLGSTIITAFSSSSKGFFFLICSYDLKCSQKQTCNGEKTPKIKQVLYLKSHLHLPHWTWSQSLRRGLRSCDSLWEWFHRWPWSFWWCRKQQAWTGGHCGR